VFSEANRQIDQKPFTNPSRTRTIYDPDEAIDTLAIVGTLGIPASAAPELTDRLRQHAPAARRCGAARTGAPLTIVVLPEELENR